MSDQHADPSIIFDDILNDVTEVVRHELASTEDDDELKLTGIEGILLTLALKATVGAISAFLGRAAFDKWKAARTRKQLKDIGASFDLDLASPIPVIDQATLEHELTTQLIDQGLTPKQARRIVDQTLDRVRARINRAQGPS